MEIIHVVLGKANPERMNGVNKVVSELASRQAAAGHKVALWGISSDLQHNYPERNYTTRLFSKRKFPFSLPDALKHAVALQDGWTVFHLHGGFLPQMYSLARLLDSLCIPFVFTPHGSYNTIAMEKNKFLKKIYCRLFEQPMLERASMIHILGESEADGLRHWMDNTPVTRIPYGYESAGQKHFAGKKRSPFVIGYCGRIDIRTKGLDALFDGFARFREEVPDSELHILGDGKEMPELQQMKEHNAAGSHIFLYGARYGEEKAGLLQAFDVFAHPSRNEGLPSAILEAAAAGIPCLVTRATNTGGFVAQYNAGVVIERTEGNAIYEGLKQLYTRIRTEQKGPELSDCARRMIREAFNWNRLLKDYYAMYLNARL